MMISKECNMTLKSMYIYCAKTEKGDMGYIFMLYNAAMQEKW